jgi:DNA-binding response OmpR family regulator
MNDARQTILVVDDDPKLRDLLARYLDKEGFAVDTVGDAVAMDAWLAERRPDLIVLDLMLPGEDGLSIARRLRAEGDLPLVMLSARGEEVDRIVGLEMGADDYLPKPFNPRELLARVRAVLRRRSTAPAPASDADRQLHRFGPFTLDLTSQRLLRDGAEVDITAGDFALLEAFAEHPNRLLSRDQLVDMIKGYERSPFDRSVDVRVTRLRRKIEPDSANPVFIRTIWGKGYMFTPQGDQVPP